MEFCSLFIQKGSNKLYSMKKKLIWINLNKEKQTFWGKTIHNYLTEYCRYKLEHCHAGPFDFDALDILDSQCM